MNEHKLKRIVSDDSEIIDGAACVVCGEPVQSDEQSMCEECTADRDDFEP
jgi:hypothetical protein